MGPPKAAKRLLTKREDPIINYNSNLLLNQKVDEMSHNNFISPVAVISI